MKEIPKEIVDEAEKRYPEMISVIGKNSDRHQRKNQRIFIEGTQFGYQLAPDGEYWKKKCEGYHRALQGLVNDVRRKPNDTRYDTHLKIAEALLKSQNPDRV